LAAGFIYRIDSIRLTVKDASKRAIDLTKDLTYIETSPNGFKFSGKTGSNFYDEEHKIRLGWFIAHISNGEKEYITATNFSDLAPTFDTTYGGAKAREITEAILQEKGLW
jgi:beta-lactamase class D